MASLLKDGGSNEIGSDNTHSGRDELVSPPVSLSDRDLSMSSGVGSSISSSDYLRQTGGTALEHSSSSVREDVPVAMNNSRLRRQPDSLPRVGNVTADGNSLVHSQSSAHTNSLHQPKQLFGMGKSSFDR